MRDIKYEMEKVTERMFMWVAWMMPRKIAYWCAVRVMVHATQGEWSDQEVPALLAIDTLQRWEPKKPAGW